MTWPDGHSVTFAYNLANRFGSDTAGGVSVTAGYDTLGRVSAVARAAGSSSAMGDDEAERMAKLANVFTPAKRLPKFPLLAPHG